MSTLREDRVKFTGMLARLLAFAESRGYEVAIDFVKRCAECPVGTAKSLHKDGLAVDLNLYKAGRYLRTTEAHKPLGEFWEALGGAWGGRFGDGDHYSLARGGRK